MESYRIDGNSEQDHTLGVEEALDVTPDLVRTLIDIDLQTFAESTFTPYTAAAFLKGGRVFLLRADEVVIGTCVCMRSWERSQEAMLVTMGIRPGWRGRGLGQRFLRGVLDRLRARGMRTVSLLVGRNNRRAIKVYEDVGFAFVEERPVDPQNDDHVVLMRAILQEDTQVIALQKKDG